MLRHRRNITHGATLGYDDQWKVMIEVGPSRLGQPGDVSHIVFEPASEQSIIDSAIAENDGVTSPSRQRDQSPEYQS